MDKTEYKIIEDYPPNYAEIKQYFDFTKLKPFFAYTDTIYNPFKVEIPEDSIYHETIHFKQQRDFGSTSLWWVKYCLDKKFRLEMELEAYAHQYNFLKPHLPAKANKEVLEEMADFLSSSLYNIGITKGRAMSLIKKYAIQQTKKN